MTCHRIEHSFVIIQPITIVDLGMIRRRAFIIAIVLYGTITHETYQLSRMLSFRQHQGVHTSEGTHKNFYLKEIPLQKEIELKKLPTSGIHDSENTTYGTSSFIRSPFRRKYALRNFQLQGSTHQGIPLMELLAS
ncbi:hypothetical protein J6590_056248 [Homalodisca vitripennis]|nr:hypothetical protein J6590_056248 [Homalodisca vitripennis]